MARMFPERFPDDGPSEAERRVFDALRDGLGDVFTVFANVQWLTPDVSGRPIDGEADFLIAHPDWGLLLLEVKGGVISFDGGRGWTSNGLRIKDPVKQARDHRYAIRRYLQNAPHTRPYSFPDGYGLWFPDVDAATLPPRPDLPVDVVLDAADLRDIGKTVEGLYGFWLGDGDFVGPGPSGLQALAQLLGKSWTLRPLLGAEIRREAEVVRTLTESQFGLLQFLGSRPRALIAGCAGSGKTMLAMEKARQLAGSGFKVLLTCFNKSLAGWVRRGLDGTGVEVTHFHDLCYRVGLEAGIPLPAEDGPRPPGRYFSDELPEALVAAAEKLGGRYDAILVDEGQDFQDTWWIPLLALLRDPDGGVLYIWYDSAQDIYGGGRSWPIGPEHQFTLPENLRTTQEIHRAFAAGIKSLQLVTCRGPQGRPPERIAPEGNTAARLELRKALHRLVAEGGIRLRDVVVLTPRSRANSAWQEGLEMGNVRLTWSADPSANEVQVSTIHAFKGLERPVVLLTELDHIRPGLEPELLYVGRSRAMHHLIELGVSSRA